MPGTTSPLLVVLLLALLLLVIGGAAVLLLSRNSSKNAQAAPGSSQPLPDLDDLVLPPSMEKGPHSVALSRGGTVEAQPVLLLLRAEDGGLIAQTAAGAYRLPLKDANPEFARQFASLLRELPAGEAASPPAPVRPAPEAKTSPPPAPIPTPTHRGALPGDLPKFVSPETTEAPRLGRRPTTGPVPDIDIAGSIETYLQYRLGSETSLAGRSLHVLPAGADGVRIEVDGQRYDVIDDIPDALVRDFLRQTISEWQQRQ